MSDTAGSPNSLSYHKPNCLCPPCQRKAKAEPRGAGERPSTVKTKARAKAFKSVQVVEPPGQPPVFMEDKSLRARAAQISAFKAMGLNLIEIADKLELSHGTVKGIVYKANKLGLIQYDDPMERFENQIVPKIVDNVEYWIDQKDKKMTIEAAKGAGIFKSHQAIKLEGEAPQTILALKIEMPTESGFEAKTIVGHTVGRPRRVITVNQDGSTDTK